MNLRVWEPGPLDYACFCLERIPLLVHQTSVYHQLKEMAPSNPSSTSQFCLHWIIPISIQMAVVSAISSTSYHPVLYSSLQQKPPKGSCYWLHFFSILLILLQPGFHPLNSNGTGLVKVTSDCTSVILSPQLTYKEHVTWLLFPPWWTSLGF